jgi:hypothetical protein
MGGWKPPLPHLETVSLLYLAGPYFLFFGGWLPVPGFLAFSSVLVLGLAYALRNDTRGAPAATPAPEPLGRATVAVALGVALAWVCFSGAGGCGEQRGDYYKHNAVLKDLVLSGWPVRYRVGTQPAGGPGVPEGLPPGSTACLSYNVAYYLPAAALGKLAGWRAAHAGMFVWTLLGTVLSLLWFARNLPSWRAAALLCFPLLSGMDCLGETLVYGKLFDATVTHKEWWADFGEYSSNTTLLFWTPQHALPGWILAGMLLHGASGGGRRGHPLFLLGLSTLWSPLVLIGLAPFAALALAGGRWRRARSFPDAVAAPALLLCVGLFYAGRGTIPHGFVWQLADLVHLAELIYHVPVAYHLWPRYLLFCLLEFGLYAALILAGARGRFGRQSVWLWAALAVLCLLPLYKVGYLHDLMMRGSIPALFLLWVFLMRCVWASGPPALPAGRRGLLVLALLYGSLWPAFDLGVAVTGFRCAAPDLGAVVSIVNMEPVFIDQYVVRGETLFFRLGKGGPDR